MTNITVISSVDIKEGKFVSKIEIYDSKGNFLFSKTSPKAFKKLTDATDEAINMNERCKTDFETFKSFPPLV